MTEQRPELSVLAALADGGYHPPAALSTLTGLPATQIAELVGQLRQAGLPVEQHPQHGYRLAAAIEPWSTDAIRNAMGPRSTALMGQLALRLQIDSTNSELRRLLNAGAPPGSACLSESQSAGRGRRGRQWIAPPARNLLLSLSWHYPADAALSGLSLALGVAASQALEDRGIDDSRLKWPNDLTWQDRKIGGILIELFPTSPQQLTVIVGIGINIDLPQAQADAIGQPCTDLQRISGRAIARNPLAGRLLHHLLIALQDFGRQTHQHWQQAYRQRDALAGRELTLTRPDGSRTAGIGRGIDAQGALLIEHQGRISSHPIGEASVRANSPAGTGTGSQP